MRAKVLAAVIVAISFGSYSNAASAQAFLSKEGLEKAGGDVVNAAKDGVKKAAPVVAPGATITLQVIQGKSLDDAVKDTATAGPRVFIDGAKAAGALDQTIEDAVKAAVGPDLAKTIEIVRLPEKIERGIAITIGETGINVVEGNKAITPQTIAAIPLAASLQQAIDLYKSRAKPIPTTVVELLSTTHSAETLNDAKFTIDDNLGSLPGAIIFLREKIGADNFAVTVGNIIVFAKDPGLSNMHFWAHELQHTAQYRKLGVQGFATKYLTDSAAMEAEAEEYGKKADEEAPIILRFLRLKQLNAQK